MRTSASLLIILSTLLGLSDALNPVVIKGYKFFDSVSGVEVVVRGIDYYPRPNTGPFNRNSVDFFTENFRHVWERDLLYLQNLGINAVRLYSVDPNQNHDAFMCALNQAGIYAVVGIASDCPTCAITSAEAPDCYSRELKTRGQAVIEEFAKYPNTLAFSAGNEVNHAAPRDKPEWNAPCLKKFIRDMRRFIDSCSTIRNVPIGLVSADSNRDENAMYYNCQGDPSDKYEGAEWYGLNAYVFCDHSVRDYEFADGLVTLQQMFERYHYSIPAVMTEYGCLSPTFETIDGYEGQRDFKQTEWLMTEPDLREQFSGGFVFEYSTELQNAMATSPYPFKSFGAQNYGVGFFEPEECDDVDIPCIFQPFPNYYYLQAVLYRTNGTGLTTMINFQVPPNRRQRSQCPKQFKPLSSYSWKADDRSDIPCPKAGQDSNFTCPANLDDLRGRYSNHKEGQYSGNDFPTENFVFGFASLLALGAVCYLMGKEVESESEMGDLDPTNPRKTLYIYEKSDESARLLSLHKRTSEGWKPEYRTIAAEDSIQEA